MHWWKKFLSNFFSDKAMDEQIEHIESHTEENRKNEQHEMKTRMIYQYPKGEFRFPLIKDQPETPVSGRQRRQEDRPHKNNGRKAPEVRQQRQGSRMTTETASRKIEPKNSQPFKPTHTPSPIYGFNRPVVKRKDTSTTPESELTHYKSTSRSEKGEQGELNKKAVNGEEVLDVWSAESDAIDTEFESAVKTYDENEVEAQNVPFEIKTWTQDQEIEEINEEYEEKIPDRFLADSHEDDEATDEDSSMALDEIDLTESEAIDELLLPEESVSVEEVHNPKENLEEEMPVSSESEYESDQDSKNEPLPSAEAEEDDEERTLGDDFSGSKGSETSIELALEETAATAEMISDEETEAKEPAGTAEMISGEETEAKEPAGTAEMISDEETETKEPAGTAEMISDEETEAKEPAGTAEMISDEETEAKEPAGTAEMISDEETEANETASTAEMISGEETEANELASRAEMISNEETEANEPTKEEPTIDEEVKENNQRPTRSHLPFNVLMLSQDRTRWQKQKERQKDKGENVLSATKVTDETEKSSSETVHYELPGLELLKPPVFKEENTEWLNEQTTLLDETMENFNVKARVVNASQGPSVTRFEVQPDKGVKVNKITNLSNDIKLSMAARDIRMEAPIPGTRSIGIELPNKESRPVQISEIIGKTAFSKAESPLTAVLGLDISGEPVVTDLRKMPHGLIAGATGSGKSVCINSILVSLLYKARPDELKLMLIDPKMVELAPYNHIPHLVSPVITDVKAATAALKWAVDEMERRYELFVHAGVRDIGRFNELAKTKGQKSEHLPYIVIIIDELADLMMVAPAEVEESICRIAQKARACGIHLLIATQRPSVDVITGLIKANVPTRIAFAVSSQVDSRTVIDVSGAEKLLGRGDMLFLNNGSVKPVRLQGTFVSDEEIDQVIEHVRNQGKPNYLFQQEELLKKAEIQENEDELLMDACEFVVKQGNASTSLLQRQFRIGYNRAARLMEMMEDQGVISGANGSKPRDVLIKEAELDLLKDSLVH